MACTVFPSGRPCHSVSGNTRMPIVHSRPIALTSAASRGLRRSNAAASPIEISPTRTSFPVVARPVNTRPNAIAAADVTSTTAPSWISR